MPYKIKDSGERKVYPSGFNRDTTEGKPRYELIPHEELRDLALHYAGGAKKYGDSNWKEASTEQELNHFIGSLLRHAHQLANGDDDEDHTSAVCFNAFAIKYLKKKLDE
jgi:hypothetical protein